MEYIAKNIPLWQVTTWDKKFNNVDRAWQPKTIKYNYLLSDELDEIRTDDGDVRILYTGKDVGYTTESLAGDNLSEGEIVSIPWGGIPTVKYYKGKFVTGDNRIATSNDVSKLSNRYLYYFMKGHIHEIASYYRGASLKHPCMKDVLKMEISYPSIEIQNRICDQFDVIESVIEQRSKELTLFDDFIKARFVEMFGEPRNSESYSYVPFEEIVDYMGDIGSNGANKVVVEHLDMKDEEDYALMVRFLNFTKNDFSEDVKYISKESYDFFKKSQLHGGELIICKIGSAGLNYVMPYLNRPVSLGLNQIMVRINEKALMPYLYQYLHTDYGEYLISGCINGAVTKSITKTELKKIPVMLPPIDEQKGFVEFVKQVDKSKVAVQKSLDETRKLFDSLMQEYFG